MLTFWKVTMAGKSGKVMASWIMAMPGGPPVFQAAMPGFLHKVMEKVKAEDDYHPEDFPGGEMTAEPFHFNENGISRLNS